MNTEPTYAPEPEEPTWSTPSYAGSGSSMADDNAEGQLTIDVYQTENDIVIKSTIAGVKPEDLDVSINNDMVTVKGERKNEEIVENGNYYYQECYWGSFSRSVLLPVDVIPEKADAALKNGILTIRLPKADTTKTKKIQVRGF
jgi:HSP20 family protein